MNGRLWLVVLLYAGMAFAGAEQIVGPGRLQILVGVFLASVASSWAVADARSRGHAMVHSVQYLILGSWPIAVPLYLMWSRGVLRGIGWTMLHALGLTIASWIGVFFTYFLLDLLMAWAS